MHRCKAHIVLLILGILRLGDGCGPGRKLSDLRKYIQFENYRGNEGVATSPECLSCTFDSGTCCWYDDSGSPLHWQRTRAKTTITSQQMQQATGRKDVPSGDFLATGSETARPAEDSANLIAEVPCLDSARLSVKWWKSTDNPDLQVCVLCPSQSTPECQSAPHFRGQEPFPVEFGIGCRGEQKGPAKIIIRAKKFTQTDFLAIDDIKYDGGFCQSDTTGVTSSPGGVTGSVSNTLQNGCSSLTCDFEKGNTCGWGPAHGDYGQWNVNSGREGSPATGIFGDATGSKEGKFAFVGRTTPNVASSTSESSSVYVLQSPRLKARNGAKLKYRLFDQSAGPIFEVCTNEGLSDCRNRVDGPIVRSGDTRWAEEQSVDLEPNKTYVISYVVRNLKTNYYVGLDNVKLEPTNGDNSGCVPA